MSRFVTTTLVGIAAFIGAACSGPSPSQAQQPAQSAAIHNCRATLSQAQCECVEHILSPDDFSIYAQLLELGTEQLTPEVRNYRQSTIMAPVTSGGLMRIAALQQGVQVAEQQCGLAQRSQ